MRFLCLHGMGSNSQVFESQISAIRYELGNRHTYEFVEGCVPTGIAPNLDGVASPEKEYFAYSDPTVPASMSKAVANLDAYVDAQGPFDGVLAFSEGAGLTASYIAWKFRQDPARQKVSPMFKFAVFFSSLDTFDPEQIGKGSNSRPLLAQDNGEIIHIPTVHIWGRNDRLTGAPRVRGICASQAREEYIHDGGHEVPGARMADAVKTTARLMRRAMFLANKKNEPTNGSSNH
ncbi:serine hydrolase FSH [Annulohypoxylon maeteangense]|uniref:serine hydrolase FSH n=1 Tax=Annulohypoxylon maeteangense TaxID=1927788 RepID=UPI002008B72A|nr:serine hydrolase FSH [Annulohypoxylon maeteangense]KAI0889176.1 serine hydrolase FSH [Annulohypoxylon maeteangense]